MTQLHFTSTGSGTPLVILHGLFGSAKNWQSHARFLATKFRVINVDLRNHGDSFHSDTMNYRVMAEDVVQLLDQLEVSQCNLLGHSMGGKVAMTVAQKYPARVARLIVADIAPLAYSHHYDDLIDPIMSIALDSIESRAQVDRLLRSSIPEDQLRAFLLQNLAREQDGWRWRVNWVVIKRDMENLTGFEIGPDDWQVSIPTLFIRGANSDYIDESGIEVIESHFSNANIETITGAGHWLQAEKPEQFDQLVIDFLGN
jgi:pimeloyl-ACP methyl ester carboxylesterase